jgi:hypothetical protein
MANPVFPTVRKYYPGIDNPLFLGDITTSQDNVLQASRMITNLSTGDFYILNGLEYVLGTPNTYTPGIIFFNNDFYYCSSTLTEGLYLAVTKVDVLSETFDDSVARNIYTNQIATATGTSAGNTPQFTGNMNQYRISNKFIQMQVLAILAITNNLGTAAEADLGTGPGQILTADQTYTQAQVNALLLTRAPSTVGCEVTVRDITGTFAANFDGNGLGIIYPWYNSATGERWGLENGVATAGGHTAPNMAGKVTIGQGTDAGSHTFTEGTPYGANTYQIQATDLPVLQTDSRFEQTGSGGLSTYLAGTLAATNGSISVNAGSPNNPINMMQSSVAVYKVIRLV